jgi:excisionase family DNA binding protein
MTIEQQNLGRALADIDHTEFMSVREAAQSLGITAAKVYKMDRVNGPFRISKRGRRVLIDRRDFDRYLGERFTLKQPADSSISTVTQKKPAGENHIPIPNTRPESAGCGQRDLVFPGIRPFVVIYMV